MPALHQSDRLNLNAHDGGVRIRYMGSKRWQSELVGQIARSSKATGPFVDLFSGMCTIASGVAPTGRRIFANDIQAYARLVAELLLTTDPPRQGSDLAVHLVDAFEQNRESLQKRFAGELLEEEAALSELDPARYQRFAESWQTFVQSPEAQRELGRLRTQPEWPYRLATLTHGCTYFGLKQAIDLDSMRAAIDASVESETIGISEGRWLLLALLQAASRCASTTGHFAQFLQARSEKVFERIRRQRMRNIWDSTFDDLAQLRPYGSGESRASNRVFGFDVGTDWIELDDAECSDAVFYADPPYSKEHYSRFYHVLETLTLYDYPETDGLGQYRRDRFTGDFARKSSIESAMRRLLESVAARDGTLILSYPDSGLLTAGLGIQLVPFVRQHFSTVSEAQAVDRTHSTLGGRHGRNRLVKERLIVAR